MIPTFVCFYTLGTMYEHEAARLRASLDVLGLKHDLRGVESKGSWAANAAMTATFLRDMLHEHDEPIVYVDADAVVWELPTLFGELSPAEYDIGIHYRKGEEALNGTLWLSNTTACRDLIDDYRQRVEDSPNERNEQRHLAKAIAASKPRVYHLPASYCWIHDIMADDIEGVPVIEHLQASRVATNSTLLPNRQRRLEEIAHDVLPRN